MTSTSGLPGLLAALPLHNHVRTTGLTGAARAWVLSRLHAQRRAPLICLTADEESADVLAADFSFFLGGEGTALAPTVLRLPADDVLPWDELVPDSAVVRSRLQALFHLAQGHSFAALVLSVPSLLKKVMPLEVIRSLSARVQVGENVGRDALARRLVDMGYLHAPLVEDAGTFSLRGDILDVFSTLHAAPMRLEFFGDTVESMRAFDSQTQRTTEPKETLHLLPARELFFSDATRRCAERRILAAAEHQHVPSSKVRERLEQVRQGLGTSGLDALLPCFFESGLQSVFAYLDAWHQEPLWWVDEPQAQERALETHQRHVERSAADAQRKNDVTLPPQDHFLSVDEFRSSLNSRRRLSGGGLTLDDGTPHVTFRFENTSQLKEAIATHHGEEGALTPFIDALGRFQTDGLCTLIACGSAGQADNLRRMLRGRQLTPTLHRAPLEGSPPAAGLHLYLGHLSQGFIDAQSHLAVISSEDIFGKTVRSGSKRKRSTKTISPPAFAT